MRDKVVIIWKDGTVRPNGRSLDGGKSWLAAARAPSECVIAINENDLLVVMPTDDHDGRVCLIFYKENSK